MYARLKWCCFGGDNIAVKMPCHSILATVNALQNAGFHYARITIFVTAMFVENLVKLGLSEKEAMLYLLLLQIGPSQVSSLAKRAKMKRVSVYSVLDSLEILGMVCFEVTSVGKRYLAQDPECLLYSLEQEKAKLSCRMALAKECIQKLSNPRELQAPLLY